MPALQDRLHSLLTTVLPRSSFYARKYAAAGVNVAVNPCLTALPFTTKAELLADQEQHPPYGTNLTEPLQNYRRLNQTSGTGGQPLRWLDTAPSWTWMLDNWTTMFGQIGLRPDDRCLFPFSFGPFLGFWTAFEAAVRFGCLCLPAGGMSSGARLRFLLDNKASVVFCTPTYALHLAEVASRDGLDLTQAGVRALVVAGEPGGSIPATRARIESAWGRRVVDHGGMTEIGPCSIEPLDRPGGLHVLDQEFIAEIIDPATGQPAPPGTPGELVLTNLGRLASPLVRYRTGDLVCLDPASPGVRLDGGIRGRLDDMLVLRGNNVHPSAVQTIVHRFPEVAEFRLQVDRSGSLPELRIEVEPLAAPANGLAERIAGAIRDELLFRAEVRCVPPGSLPRFEMKAQRLVQTPTRP